MEPVSPVLAPEFVPNEVIYAKDQPQYNPLPVLKSPDGIVLSRWKLSDAEREAVAAGADILLSLWTFNQPLTPIIIEVLECNREAMAIAERMGLLTPEPSAHSPA
jgi:hypothetical protein